MNTVLQAGRFVHGCEEEGKKLLQKILLASSLVITFRVSLQSTKDLGHLIYLMICYKGLSEFNFNGIFSCSVK